MREDPARAGRAQSAYRFLEQCRYLNSTLSTESWQVYRGFARQVVSEVDWVLSAARKGKLSGGLGQSANFATGHLRNLLTRIFNLMYDLPTFQRPSASLFIGARSR